MGFGREYVVGWGTLALINAGLAQGKGRSGLNWFLVSLVLGPIATLAIVAIDKVELRPALKREPLKPWVQVLAGALILLAIVLATLGRH
jgi:hypothetical protein